MRFFTLLEVLVVMVVIAVLASLTFPLLAKAVDQANKASCYANFRVISQAVEEYGEDNDGFALPASFGATTHGTINHWANYLYHIQGVEIKAFRCPASAAPFDPDGHSPTQGNVLKRATYIMNIIGPGQWSGADVANKGSSTGWGLNSVRPIRNTDVINPVSAIRILDAVEGIYSTHSGVNSFNRTDHGMRAYPPTGQTRWVGDHHNNGGFNVLFGDGHVEFRLVTKHDEWKVTEQDL